MENGYKFNFEKLEVWQLSKALTISIYKITEKFPTEEKYSLTSQIRRAVLSIGANIAEGTTRNSLKEQAHFSSISFGSLMELLNHLIIATELSYLKNDVLNDLKNQIQIISIKLSNLKSSQLQRSR